jgi:3-isopropylmalate/(R)-2-methylmalate dehydratase large subunit
VSAHAIEGARLKQGARLQFSRAPSGRPPRANRRIVEGTALILWDPLRPGEKLDAIDTDQITPAADCVSESLEALDEKWKEGAFRYLVPDFRKRVHAGETFVVAGDRFGIGSSREMSPAGLKAVAEEVGLELVVVCGDNVGDIFRRNAFSLGLEVVQSKEAVKDARDGDRFSYDRETRKLTNLTQSKTYEPVALTTKENEIRTTGGIFAIGRRELESSIARTPRIEWPDEKTARKLTTTEQIVWAHRVDENAEVKPGGTLRVYADLLPASDGTAPFAIHTFHQITGGNLIYPRQAAIANDHFVFTEAEADALQTSIGREFARKNRMEKPYYAAAGDGIFHFYFPEQGLIAPGQFVAGADSHSRAYGAYGAVGIGVGSTTLGFGWSTGYIYFTLAAARRVIFEGALPPWVSGKDVVLALLERWGEAQSQGMSVEFVDEGGQLGVAYRNTICNMMAEGEALNGVFAADDITYAWYRAKKLRDLPYPRIQPGALARYEIEERLDISSLRPMIAKPYSPANAFPAEEVARERLSFDKAYIGSCTNGSYDDLLQAALVLRAAKELGRDSLARPLVVFPGSGGVKRDIERPEPRLGGESIASVLRALGGRIRDSWCGPCFGQGPDALAKGETAITSFNRNWKNRMGIGGLGYLASPAVVASSALVGYMAPPSELGLEWDPEKFGA